MNKFKRLLQQVIEQPDTNVQIKMGKRGIEVVFQNGRRQRITVERQEERYIMTSVVLGRRRVERIGRAKILARLWQRNRETDVVTFSLDKQGRLVGCIGQMAESIDRQELTFYVNLLARKCDQFEYALSGQDLQ